LIVASDIARTYVALRGAQQRLSLTQDSLDLQRRTVEIVSSRVNAGLAPGLDLSRAEASVQALEADLSPIETEIRQARDSLSTLLGRRPGGLDELVPTNATSSVPAILATPVLGQPADLLRRRPDLRAAERYLQSATAGIGVAKSALYPSLTIPAKFQVTMNGFGAAEIIRTLLASLGATLSIPIFDGGAARADLTVAEEQAHQALITYRTTLLTALSEVESALHAHDGAQRRLQALDRAVAADARAYEQASTLYAQGLTSFLDILDAQRTMTTTRLRQVVTQTDLATTAINLFQAAGFAPHDIVAKSPTNS
jgi:NodT family efflux transporter outer membrane factor (OMF) lipoprotein